MSQLTDALNNFQKAIPTVLNFAPSVENLVTGLGSPIVGVNPPSTEEEKKQQAQVKAKMELDPLDYARWIYKMESQGFNKNLDNYKGKPTDELAASNAQRIAQRNSEASAQRNFKLGRMRLDKSADTLRLATENSLANQQMLDYNDADAAYKHYLSQVDEMNSAGEAAHKRGVTKAMGIINPAIASKESTAWVPTAIGAIGSAVTGGGDSLLKAALLSGASTGGDLALKNNAQYFKEKLGTSLDLNPIPLTQAQWTAKKWNKQTGKE